MQKHKQKVRQKYICSKYKLTNEITITSRQTFKKNIKRIIALYAWMCFYTSLIVMMSLTYY